MTTAALGGTIEVPAIDGSRARINIPPGAQTGQQFRLRGKGMSVLRSAARGDMYRRGRGRDAGQPDQAPAGAAARVREAGGKGKSHSPEAEGFFAKVKEILGGAEGIEASARLRGPRLVALRHRFVRPVGVGEGVAPPLGLLTEAAPV